MRILIAYPTSHDHTRTIANALADDLQSRGHEVELADVESRAPSPADYDAVVLGSRVQFRKHSRAIVAYVGEHRAQLADVPSFFFSVSSSAYRATRSDPRRYTERLFREAAWRPLRTAEFVGELAYRKYRPVVRLVIKLIMKMTRAPAHLVDTMRDHVLTEWVEVARFADQLANDLESVAKAS